ncbi:hypothetical protein Hte_008605 [Hypoxylon texense]
MPPAPPTCAARIIRNEPLQNGWGSSLSGDINSTVSSVKKYAKDCYVFQLDRERPVDASSLSSALFWEHRHILQPRILSTPAADYCGFFNADKRLFNENFGKIQQKVRNSKGSIKVNALFGPLRDREFTIWPVRVPEGPVDDDTKYWITIIMRIQPKTAVVKDSRYFDREVTDIAIIDPISSRRDSRRKFVEKKLGQVLAQGCIDFSDATTRRDLLAEDTGAMWTSGYIAYAICREFIRRLRVLIFRRQASQSTPVDFLWDNFEESYNFDTYRESLMAACAHQTIEKSGYVVRMALDVPSEKTSHNPARLTHLHGRSADWPEEDVPDEDYTEAAPKVIVQISEGMKVAGDESNSHEFTSDSDADESGTKETNHTPISSSSDSPRGSMAGSPAGSPTGSVASFSDGSPSGSPAGSPPGNNNKPDSIEDDAMDIDPPDYKGEVHAEPSREIPVGTSSTPPAAGSTHEDESTKPHEDAKEEPREEKSEESYGVQSEQPHKHPLKDAGEDAGESPLKKPKLDEEEAQISEEEC